MTKEERLKVYDEAVEIWGIVGQYDQCVEEMAELTVAISKFKRKLLHNEYQGQAEIENNLVEEIADVFICIEEMINLFGEDKVNAAIEQKMQKFKNEIKEIKK
ncbi:MAG: hypothetical protein IKK20_00220 [Clostridia bacterium]|nr:hypothetical protein [Clostridia bacterium]MBR3790216.1 hypothetical protein [Clostridia bacterium]